jgi:hypothetical protein
MFAQRYLCVMTHLTPQVRTDKNGRAVIRHMKPESSTTGLSSGRPIPAVAAPVVGLSNAVVAHEIRDMVLPLAGPVPVALEEHFEGFLDETYEDSPYISGLMKRCLTTGSDTARRSAVNHIQNSVKMFREGLSHPIEGVNLAKRMMMSWNEENVLAETSRIKPNKLTRANQAIRPDFKQDTPDNDIYWRGIAAARIVYDETGGTVSLDPSIDFILNRAGAHPDIAAVIDIAIDRRTLDMDVIEHVINDSKETLSLRGGFL